MELDAARQELEKQKSNYQDLLARKKQVEQSRDKYAADLRELQQLHRQKMAEYEQKTNELTGKKNELTANLNSANRQLARCRTHNAQLSVIGSNLATMIQEKDGGLIKEPVFQAGRIEIEKIAQQYLEDIDKLKEKSM